jgi:glycosyltransferase involved in cell wall biosynthesis
LLKELGLCGAHLGIFIGSLHKDKRLDFLFAAADLLHEKVKDFELLIIGDGPLNDEAARFTESRRWVRWVGARHGREKVLYASLGRVMLNPGMVGLGILDSYALGIPIVTTDCGIHSPEIAYLRSQENGLLTADDRDAFANGVISLLEDSPLAEKLCAGCLADAEKYTIENMLENFSDGIVKALSAKRCQHSH